MGTFGTQVLHSNGQAVVRVHGEVDVYTAPRLWETLDTAIAATPNELIIDLSDVTFLDSSGLACLVRAHKRLRPIAGSVVIRGAAEQVRMTLDVTKLTSVLSVEAPARAS